MTLPNKTAETDHPIHESIAKRWSPYVFSDKPVSREDLLSLFEAARWAASSFNEQPWRYIMATKESPDEFERLLGCLVEANQDWARRAPVLMLGVVSTKFARNGNDNRVAFHDLGLASASLTFEATSRGLFVHQMAGILPDKARETYAIPEGFEPWTGLAIGYADDSDDVPGQLRARETAPRQRKKLNEFVFENRWERPAGMVRFTR
jgi:nitroreductase